MFRISGTVHLGLWYQNLIMLAFNAVQERPSCFVNRR